MGDEYYLTDLTTELRLHYDIQAQAYYRMKFGIEVQAPEPQVRWHQAEGYPAEIVAAVDQNRTSYFEVDIFHPSGEGRNAVLNKVHVLQRMLDQALRHQLDGDARRVYLKVRPVGATNATLIPVILGVLKTDTALYSQEAETNEIVWGAALALTLEPYGQADTPITLKNYLINPSFETGSGTAGLAGGWELTGAPTITRTTVGPLIGAYRTGLTIATNGDGIRQAVEGPAGMTEAVGYIWFRNVAGDWSLVLRDTTTATTLGATTISIANADRTETVGGITWYRVVVSAQGVTPGNNVALWVRSDIGIGTSIILDAAYLTFGTTTAPAAWSSYYQLQNRADTSAANPERINYIDVWGVPGDAPALVDFLLDWKVLGSLKDKLLIGKKVDGKYRAAAITGWIESDEFTGNTAAFAAWSAGTGTSNNHYFRLTQNGTANEGSGTRTTTLSGSAARYVADSPKRAFAIVRSSNTSSTFWLTYATSSTTLHTSQAKTVGAANTWTLVDLGLINAAGVFPEDVADASYPVTFMTISVAIPQSSSATADIDAVLLMPVDEILLLDEAFTLNITGNSYIRGSYRDAYFDQGLQHPAMFGSMWYAEAGNTTTRYRLAIFGSNDSYNLTDAVNITTLSITPRTRHLLGTA